MAYESVDKYAMTPQPPGGIYPFHNQQAWLKALFEIVEGVASCDCIINR